MHDDKQKMLALTFDDGPGIGTMVRIMDLLHQYEAHATFFVVGDNITETSAPILRDAVQYGHELGNHSQSHRHMSVMDREDVIREVMTLQKQMEQITGIRPMLFRPPYLDVSPLMMETIQMPFIGGDGNNDWDINCTVSERVALAMSTARDGAILLMHCFDGNEATEDALKVILPELKQQGYQIVTVSQLFAEKKVVLQNGVLYTDAISEK